MKRTKAETTTDLLTISRIVIARSIPFLGRRFYHLLNELFEDCLLQPTTVFSRFSSLSVFEISLFFSLRSDSFFRSTTCSCFVVAAEAEQNINRLQTEQPKNLSCHSPLRSLYISPSLYIPFRDVRPSSSDASAETAVCNTNPECHAQSDTCCLAHNVKCQHWE